VIRRVDVLMTRTKAIACVEVEGTPAIIEEKSLGSSQGGACEGVRLRLLPAPRHLLNRGDEPTRRSRNRSRSKKWEGGAHHAGAPRKGRSH